MSLNRLRPRRLILILLSAALAGCVNVKEDVKKQVPSLVKGPQAAPFRTVTDFTEPLRCMDTLFVQYGIYDISMLVENLQDDTKKVKVGARDMLVSAVSEMTRRSQAVRLITFGSDSGNLVSFLSSAHSNSAYSVVPRYDIRGSISQLDKSIASKDLSGGLDVGKVGIGGARTANASVLGLDLSVISTKDYSVIPGVTAKNSVVIYKQGSGLDSDATIGKFGINFSMNFTRAEGDDQALRNLIELAVIELVGKLTNTPYWLCLGGDPDTEEIKDLVYDWYYGLVADKQIVGYFQNQLNFRGFYSGPTDGQYTAALTESITAYKKAIGLEPDGNIDEEAFAALLNRPVPAPPGKPEQSQSLPNAKAGVELRVTYVGSDAAVLKPGEAFQVRVSPGADTHVYCYYQNEKRQIQRIFPNRFQTASLVRKAEPLLLPGKMDFKLFASRNGNAEKLACYSAPRELIHQLPAALKGQDFANLPVDSLESVRVALTKILGAEPAGALFEINVE